MGVWLRKFSHRFHGFAQMAWLRKSSHRIHGIHRSLGVLLAAWVWQDAIPSYICVNPCYLLETLLCKKLLCVPWVLWEYSLPRITQICTDGLVASVLPRNSQKFWGAVGSMGTAGCHTLLICAHPCYLWETLLCKKLLCVPWVLWEYSLPRISQINTDGWLR